MQRRHYATLKLQIGDLSLRKSINAGISLTVAETKLFLFILIPANKIGFEAITNHQLLFVNLLIDFLLLFFSVNGRHRWFIPWSEYS